eukprot:bmy_15631T0
MTSRNLQAAIGDYYDFERPNISVPSMSFVEDVTIGEGESIPSDTQFIKTWRMQNSGAEAWPPGVCFKYVRVDQFGLVHVVMVRPPEPQEIEDVSVQVCSPGRAGMYQDSGGYARPQDSTMEMSSGSFSVWRTDNQVKQFKRPWGFRFDSISKNTWAPIPDRTKQDGSRPSQNSVNLSPSRHANSLSVSLLWPIDLLTHNPEWPK